MSGFGQRAAQSYLQSEVVSRTPLELVVMLYDGALRFMAQARDAMVAKDVRRRQEAMTKVLAIVGELQATLDMEKGGEISKELDRLYSYARQRLLDASFKRDPAPIEEVIRLFTTLRDGWAQIARPGAAPQQAPR